MERWGSGVLRYWQTSVREYMNAVARPLGRAQGMGMVNCQLYNKQSIIPIKVLKLESHQCRSFIVNTSSSVSQK